MGDEGEASLAWIGFFFFLFFYFSSIICCTRKRLEGFSIDKFRFGNFERSEFILEIIPGFILSFLLLFKFCFFEERFRLIISSNRLILINYEKHSNIFFFDFYSEINFILKRTS